MRQGEMRHSCGALLTVKVKGLFVLLKILVLDIDIP